MWSGLIGLALLAGFLAWLLRGRQSADPPEPEYRNYEEMEAAQELRDAEQEVQGLDSGARRPASRFRIVGSLPCWPPYRSLRISGGPPRGTAFAGVPGGMVQVTP